jgi:hypothetical protein
MQFAAGESAVKLDPSLITGAVGTAVNDTIGLMGSLLPLALTIFAAIWGVRKAMGFFKKMS